MACVELNRPFTRTRLHQSFAYWPLSLPISNKILLSLPQDDCNRVISETEFVRLSPGQVIHDARDTITCGYFVNTGVISILAAQPDGKGLEVGVIGSEGFTALPLLVGYHTSPTQLISHGDGIAYRCDAVVLKTLVRQYPQLERQLHRYGQQLTMQTEIIAACNLLHDTKERLARWLLMCHDRALTDTLQFTQEFMARILGARRATVNAAAGILQKEGSISYARGSLVIVNRKKLEHAACDCYGIVRRQIARWEDETGGLTP